MFDVLLPLKSLPLAKSRLAAVLTSAQRQDLAVAMARDVLATLMSWPDCGSVVVLQGKEWPPVMPASARLKLVSEGALLAGTLNELLHRGVEWLRAPRQLVLFADLPCLSVADLEAVGAALGSGSGVVCPDRRRRGTNALAFNAGSPPAFVFGVDSCQRHQQAFSAGGMSPVAVDCAGLAWDIDTPDDLFDLLWGNQSGLKVGPATREWLESARDRGLLVAEKTAGRVSQGLVR